MKLIKTAMVVSLTAATVGVGTSVALAIDAKTANNKSSSTVSIATKNDADALSATNTPMTRFQQALGDSMRQIAQRYPDVHARTFVDNEKETFVISFKAAADAKRVAAYKAEVVAVHERVGAPYELTPVSYTLDNNTRVMNEVLQYFASEESPVRNVGATGLPDLYGDGVIRVSLEAIETDETMQRISAELSTKYGVDIEVTSRVKPVGISS